MLMNLELTGTFSKFSVLDFEGTSRTSRALATEIGLVRLNNSLESSDEFETVLQPPVKPLKESMSYARLSMGEINSAPTFKEVWPQISTYFSDSVLVAHNKIYEIGILENEFLRLGEKNFPPFICTLEWSRKILGSRLSSHALGRVCSYFDIPLDNAHEAIADARATAVLFRKLMELSPEMVNSAIEISHKVVNYPSSTAGTCEPRVRDRFSATSANASEIDRALFRITALGKRLVVITGTPDIGKTAFGETLSEVSLEYRETPPTMGTAFVIQANTSSGMSKIRKAQELGIPVLSEGDALLVVMKIRRG
jgi:DNA polymerase III epsilon subunit-like protein